MINKLRTLVALFAAVVLTGLGLTLASPAHATDAGPSWASCKNLANFYDNEDEQQRKPTPAEDGLTFENDQLVHHAVAMDLKDVKPGAYVASPAPSLDDFFSIEVYSTADPHGYATLRYEQTGPHAGEWNIGGTSEYNTDPVKLAKENGRSTNVVSFGVGYVATPATGSKTVVSSVTFHGVTYDLTCKPDVKPSASSSSPTPKPSTTSSKPHASASHSATQAAGVGGTGSGTDGGALAITGIDAWQIVVGGVGMLAFGGLAYMLARRRRVRFTA